MSKLSEILGIADGTLFTFDGDVFCTSITGHLLKRTTQICDDPEGLFGDNYLYDFADASDWEKIIYYSDKILPLRRWTSKEIGYAKVLKDFYPEAMYLFRCGRQPDVVGISTSSNDVITWIYKPCFPNLKVGEQILLDDIIKWSGK